MPSRSAPTPSLLPSASILCRSVCHHFKKVASQQEHKTKQSGLSGEKLIVWLPQLFFRLFKYNSSNN